MNALQAYAARTVMRKSEATASVSPTEFDMQTYQESLLDIFDKETQEDLNDEDDDDDNDDDDDGEDDDDENGEDKTDGNGDKIMQGNEEEEEEHKTPPPPPPENTPIANAHGPRRYSTHHGQGSTRPTNEEERQRQHLTRLAEHASPRIRPPNTSTSDYQCYNPRTRHDMHSGP